MRDGQIEYEMMQFPCVLIQCTVFVNTFGRLLCANDLCEMNKSGLLSLRSVQMVRIAYVN